MGEQRERKSHVHTSGGSGNGKKEKESEKADGATSFVNKKQMGNFFKFF